MTTMRRTGSRIFRPLRRDMFRDLPEDEATQMRKRLAEMSLQERQKAARSALGDLFTELLELTQGGATIAGQRRAHLVSMLKAAVKALGKLELG